MFIITIIVVIILAGAVILNLTNNNPIETSKEAAFKTKLVSYNSQLSLWKESMYTKDFGFEESSLNANKISGTYIGGNRTVNFSNIKEIITSITDVDVEKFEIVNVKLEITRKATEDEIAWANSICIEITDGQYDSAKGVNKPKL